MQVPRAGNYWVLVRRLLCSWLGIGFDTKGCHDIPGSPRVFLGAGGRTVRCGNTERWSSSLPTHLSPARALLHEKVSPGLRASSYHSSGPPGAGYRTHSQTISVSEQPVPPQGGLESLPGLNSANRGAHVSPQVSSQSRLTRFGTCIKVVFNTSRLVRLWGMSGRRTRVDTSAGFGSGQQTLSHPTGPAPVLCVVCLCYTHRWQ